MIKGYPFLYETHLHTCMGSACARNTGKEMAKAAKEKGYAGIFITEHNWNGNNCLNPNLSWDEWVDAFVGGYDDAYSYGIDNDLDVFWAYEATYNGTDFLIYGIDKEWLKKHPEIKDASIEKQYELIHKAGGIIIHAHPFRRAHHIPEICLYPNFVDGVEGINASHSNSKSKGHYNPLFDKEAIEYARKNNLPLTAGSDAHSIDLLGGGMAFKRRLKSAKDFCEAILNDEDYVLTNGEEVYDKDGNLLYKLSK